jgi:GMP synthase (glutamine-hydrolysing)
MSETVYMVTHAEDEGPGLLGDYFGEVGRETVLIELYRGDFLPEDLDSAAGIVILGGPMNAYEEEKYPFLKGEGAFIRMVLRREIPFLGICRGPGSSRRPVTLRLSRPPKRKWDGTR